MLAYRDLSACSIILWNAVVAAQAGCKAGWAAQVLKCFAQHGKAHPFVRSSLVQNLELMQHNGMQQQSTLDSLPLDPCFGPGEMLCTYCYYFSRPVRNACLNRFLSGTATLLVLRF